MGDKIEQLAESVIDEVERKAELTDDPELFRARVSSKMEKKVALDHGWREG